MTAMEKAAWTELLVSVFTVAIVTSLYPWLGNRATAAFGLLGLIVLGTVFLRRRGAAVVVDERDREIANRAGRIGVGSAWMMSLIVLATTSLWSNYNNQHAVSTALINWLIWTQFAMCYGVTGLVAVIAYRRRANAA